VASPLRGGVVGVELGVSPAVVAGGGVGAAGSPAGGGLEEELVVSPSVVVAPGGLGAAGSAVADAVAAEAAPDGSGDADWVASADGARVVSVVSCVTGALAGFARLGF
jgi:hypothetical protein